MSDVPTDVLAAEVTATPATIMPAVPALIEVRNLSVWYGTTRALNGVSYDLVTGEILAFIGPSGCGKTTALKCLNRMLDGVRDIRIEGTIRMTGQDIYTRDLDPPEYRKRFGWVAQTPNPFASSIYDNIAYGAGIHGLTRNKADMDVQVESCLRRADLWEEVKDKLHTESGQSLSVGQQQRLCIARALGTNPEVLLMDEPTGSIDPNATRRIEKLVLDLRGSLTTIVITHSMMEARRVADRVAMFYMGRLIEIGTTAQIFEHPALPETQAFIHGATG